MDDKNREQLFLLSPEVRVERMRGLLGQIKETGMRDSVPLGQFIDLYDVHEGTGTDEFMRQLDVDGEEFWEGRFDEIVEAYDEITGFVDSLLKD